MLFSVLSFLLSGSCDITSHSFEVVAGTTVLLERLESAIWWLRYSRLTVKVQFCSVDCNMVATFTFLPHLFIYVLLAYALKETTLAKQQFQYRNRAG